MNRIIGICQDNGVNPPVFEEIGDALRVSIYRRKIELSAVNGDKTDDKTAINDKIGDK